MRVTAMIVDDMVIFVSGEIVALLAQAGLIDESQMAVSPVL